MEDINGIIKAWERCEKCRMYPAGMSQAYLDCEYTTGLYCRQDKLVLRTLDILKELRQRMEPAEPITDKLRNKKCPRCGTVLKGKFCHECGQGVKWDG